MKKRAFTLIEIMVAMGLASFVFLITSSLMVTLVNSNNKSKSIEAMEQVKTNLFLELTNSIRWAKTVSLDANRITIDGPVVYSMQNGMIMRNTESITPSTVRVTGFEVTQYSSMPLYPSYQVVITLEDARFGLVHERLELVVSNRKATVNIAT